MSIVAFSVGLSVEINNPLPASQKIQQFHVIESVWQQQAQ